MWGRWRCSATNGEQKFPGRPSVSGRATKQRLEDILTAIREIESSMAGLEHDHIAELHEKANSITLDFFRIGEAVTHLPTELTQLRPEVPWRQIRHLRNIIAHVYWGVDMETLCETAVNDLPQLKDAVTHLLAHLLSTEES